MCNAPKAVTLLTITSLLLVVGCTNTATLDYTPTTTAEIRGKVSINSFKDSRGSEIEKNDINQINTLTGRNLHMTENISDIVTDATRREFRQAGISLRDAHCVLDGEVNKFNFEMLPIASGFNYFNEIHYTLKGPASAVLYDKVINTKYEAGIINLRALGNDLSRSLSNNINQLLTDTAFVSSVEQNCK